EDYPLALASVAVLLLAFAGPIQRAGIRTAQGAAAYPELFAAGAFALLATGASFVYHRHPLSMDEYAPYFQSEAFASGHIAAHLPPQLIDWLVPPGFQGAFLEVSHSTGSVASGYWPGFALLLTPFSAVGVPWLCNPVLAALSLV